MTSRVFLSSTFCSLVWSSREAVMEIDITSARNTIKNRQKSRSQSQKPRKNAYENGRETSRWLGNKHRAAPRATQESVHIHMTDKGA